MLDLHFDSSRAFPLPLTMNYDELHEPKHLAITLIQLLMEMNLCSGKKSSSMESVTRISILVLIRISILICLLCPVASTCLLYQYRFDNDIA